MKKVTIRLPDDLHAQLAKLARDHRRSVNAEVAWLIEQAGRVARQTVREAKDA
jgi:predicted transcriptional regulator